MNANERQLKIDTSEFIKSLKQIIAISVTYFQNDYYEQEMEIRKGDLDTWFEGKNRYLVGKTYHGNMVAINSEQIIKIMGI